MRASVLGALLASCVAAGFVLEDHPEDTDRLFSNFVPIFDDDNVGFSFSSGRYARAGRQLDFSQSGDAGGNSLNLDQVRGGDSGTNALKVLKAPDMSKERREGAFLPSPVDEMAERIGKSLKSEIIVGNKIQRKAGDAEKKKEEEEPMVLLHQDGQMAEFLVGASQTFHDPPVVATHQSVHTTTIKRKDDEPEEKPQLSASTRRRYSTTIEVVSPRSSGPDEVSPTVQTPIPHRQIEKTTKRAPVASKNPKVDVVLPHMIDLHSGHIVLPHHTKGQRARRRNKSKSKLQRLRSDVYENAVLSTNPTRPSEPADVSPHELAIQANQWLMHLANQHRKRAKATATTKQSPASTTTPPPRTTSVEGLPSPAFLVAAEEPIDAPPSDQNVVQGGNRDERLLTLESQKSLSPTSNSVGFSPDLDRDIFGTEPASGDYFDTIFRQHVEKAIAQDEGSGHEAARFERDNPLGDDTLFRDQVDDGKLLPPPRPLRDIGNGFSSNGMEDGDDDFRPSLQIFNDANPGEAIYYSNSPMSDTEFAKMMELESNFLRMQRSLIKVDEPVAVATQTSVMSDKLQPPPPPFATHAHHVRQPRRNHRKRPKKPKASRKIAFPKDRVDRIDIDSAPSDSRPLVFRPSARETLYSQTNSDFNPIQLVSSPNLSGHNAIAAYSPELTTVTIRTTLATTTPTTATTPPPTPQTTTTPPRLVDRPRWPLSNRKRQKNGDKEPSGSGSRDRRRVATGIPKAALRELGSKSAEVDVDPSTRNTISPPSRLLPPLLKDSPPQTAQKQFFGGAAKSSLDSNALFDAIVRARKAALPQPHASHPPLQPTFKSRLFDLDAAARYVDKGFRTVTKWLPGGIYGLWAPDLYF